jgi:MAF protein
MWLNLPFRTTMADIDERQESTKTPSAMAVQLAKSKAHAIHAQNEEWILAADTIVDLDQTALGKPQSHQEATTMLKQLRNRSHQVHTGVALYHPTTDTKIACCVTTEVWMRPYSDTEIESYVASQDPMDKAGAYAIQHAGFHPVTRVARCYANVVGLPLCAVAALLEEWELPLTIDITHLCLEHFSYQCPAPDKGIRL